METNSLKIGRNIQMSERSALIKQVKNLRYVLKKKDEEIGSLRNDLAKAAERIE